MGYIKFYVRCRKCGHLNRPDPNSKTGVLLTLIGKFNKCRKCGHEWKEIHVPYRPLVKEIVEFIKEENGWFSTRVKIRGYKGQVPNAYGI